MLEGGAAVIFYKSAHRHERNCVYYIVLFSKNSFFQITPGELGHIFVCISKYSESVFYYICCSYWKFSVNSAIDHQMSFEIDGQSVALHDRFIRLAFNC